MKRFFVIALVLLSAAFASAQTQNAAVKHNTYLRQGPSVDDKKVLLLKTGDELELIDPDPTDNITTSVRSMAEKVLHTSRTSR
jgi:uncharacterized protein YgiM (DUF1202 family)